MKNLREKITTVIRDLCDGTFNSNPDNWTLELGRGIQCQTPKTLIDSLEDELSKGQQSNCASLLRETVDELKQLHAHHYRDCQGGCPADDIIARAEVLLGGEGIKRDSTAEPIITINGHMLTDSQSAALRVAAATYPMYLKEEGLGDDEHGRTMVKLYTERLNEVSRLMVGVGA